MLLITNYNLLVNNYYGKCLLTIKTTGKIENSKNFWLFFHKWPNKINFESLCPKYFIKFGYF